MIEGGAPMFDTAPFYHAAQARLGRALEKHPGAFVASKVGTVQTPFGRLAKDYSPQGIRAQVDLTRCDLRRDRIDLVHLHGAPPEVVADPAVRGAFDTLRSKGVVSLIGATLRTAEEFQACLAADWIDVIQAPLEPGPVPDWPQLAAEAGKGVLAIEALRAAGGSRALRSPADLWYLARQARHGDGGVQGVLTAEDALRRALAQPGVTAVVTTSVRLAHVRANLAVACSR
jgi:aryl-alcohol dehydrogenase-like predicted oxidoreductase